MEPPTQEKPESLWHRTVVAIIALVLVFSDGAGAGAIIGG